MMAGVVRKVADIAGGPKDRFVHETQREQVRDEEGTTGCRVMV